MTSALTPAVIATVLGTGAAGAVGRYLMMRVLPVKHGRVPLAILLVNTVGSGLAGVVVGFAERSVLSPDARLILLTGLCGALTTFSTWTVDTVRLIRERRYLPAAFNIAGTTVLAVGAATTGYLLAR
ncbi:MAG: hypothetical protein B5766_11965 [Candidatus Lumbricidophila eiseniae]|uniref:Fluoride-specific ion channel FluC n=1 Tax=Candidatus Lumbricidiphila eiseniae TaxID=1969409 RepID=A0A2A6FN87_9MICO|nr:MAG: hypothetical protein B5766_11965 [Candidatus Lumbricidophila eiseniae]